MLLVKNVDGAKFWGSLLSNCFASIPVEDWEFGYTSATPGRLGVHFGSP